MTAVTFLIILCSLLLAALAAALIHIARVKAQTKQAAMVLNDIASGNLDRRIITREDTGISALCYKINEIAVNVKTEAVNNRQAERTYRQLITSLSHDIRTPMTSLIGYLSAVRDGIALNAEKTEYIRLSLEKAFDLKEYVDTLFEWLKLESGERIFDFEELDICELTREIITDWIPQMEKGGFDYDISIPETEVKADIDKAAYRRIINNLLQNIFTHSGANGINLKISQTGQSVEMVLTDNGIGISERDLPYIFDRLYKCGAARSTRGNGLGLAIVNELIKAHGGKVSVSSVLGQGASFTLVFTCKRS